MILKKKDLGSSAPLRQTLPDDRGFVATFDRWPIEKDFVILKIKDLAKVDPGNKGVSPADRQNKGLSSILNRLILFWLQNAKGAVRGCASKQELFDFSALNSILAVWEKSFAKLSNRNSKAYTTSLLTGNWCEAWRAPLPEGHFISTAKKVASGPLRIPLRHRKIIRLKHSVKKVR